MSRRIAFGVPGAVLLLLSQALLARGVTPYLPLNLDPDVERQVERVLILAGKPVMTRPIPAAVVYDALPRACKVDPVLCEHVRKFLSHYMHTEGIGFATLEGSVAHGSSNTDHAQPAWRDRRQPLPGGGHGLPAAERLHAGERGRRGLRGPHRANRLDAEPRLRLGAARSRLPRPLVVADDQQLDADQHRSADHALDHAVELRAAQPAWAAVRDVRGAHVGDRPDRAHRRHLHPRQSEVRRVCISASSR